MTLSNADFLQGNELAPEQHKGLSDILEKITEIDGEIGTTSALLKNQKAKRAALEKLAVEELAKSRLDGVKVAGRSWRVSKELRLSVAKESRSAVMDAAKSVGIEEEITTVSVPTLKAWIVEQAKEAGKDAGSSFIKGTPFDGLVGEFIETKIRHTTVG